MDIVEQSRRRIPAGSFFKHYKGNTYRVLNVAIAEDTGKPLVVYESHLGEIYARPVTEWEELLDTNGRLITRFQKLPRESEPSHWIPAQLAFDLQKKAKEYVKPVSMKAAAEIIGVDMDEFMRLLRAENPTIPGVTPPPPAGLITLAGWDINDGVEEDSPAAEARKMFPAERVFQITEIERLLMSSQRFSDWFNKKYPNADLAHMSGPFSYDAYIKERYPTEYAWILQLSQEFKEVSAIRIYDPTDREDALLFQRMRCAYSSEAHRKFYVIQFVEPEDQMFQRGALHPATRILEFTHTGYAPFIERLPDYFKFTNLDVE